MERIARASRPSSRAGTCPAARVAGTARPSGWGPGRATGSPGRRRAPASARLRRSRLARGGRGAQRRPDRGRTQRTAPTTCPRHSPRRSSTRDGSRSTRPTPFRPSPSGWPHSRPSACRCSPTILDHGAASRSRLPSRVPTVASSLPRVTRQPPRSAASSSRPGRPSSATRSSRSSSLGLRRTRSAGHPGRVRHPDRRLHPERRAPQPDDRGCRRRAARPDPPGSQRPPADGPSGSRGPLRHRRPRATRAPARGPSSSIACSGRWSCRSSRCWHGWRRSGSRSISRRWRVLDQEFASRDRRASSRRSTRDVGHEFNLGSPKQLEQILFFELNLPKGKRTKTGYSTDASVLEELRPAHPMIDKLLEWRIYTKLRSTYVEALPTLIADDGRAAHDLPPGRRLHGPAFLVRPEPPEHPDPDSRSAGGSGARSWPAPGRHAARRGLLADRAADPRPRLRRRAPQGRIRAEGRHPPRDRCPRAPQGPGRDHARTSGRWPRWSTSGSRTG